jgi:PHD/YefM family antitoxin component YafN of YafNO toxin-antitoxin module
MITLELSQATAPLAEYAQHVSKEPTVLTDNGKPVAALVFLENVDWETIKLSSHPQFIAIIEKSTARLKAEGGLSSLQMRRELGLDS